ncbi:hypothetical protein GH714_040171 [Hevea brasiliensis]|uniref:Uncharacterized protein n=1 Tax=Hevea brasiliensis TaxID=3981 RepID=A0A6A6MPS1_HEVBR|nr:hypothetical protein GH714_040171 [Hevea brasiliensis]
MFDANRTDLCRFSGAKIYLVRASDCSLRLPGIPLCQFKMQEDIAAETVKKRRRATKKPYSRSIGWATLESYRRGELRSLKYVMLQERLHSGMLSCCCEEIKERIKKTKDEKKAKKAEVMAKTQDPEQRGTDFNAERAVGMKLWSLIGSIESQTVNMVLLACPRDIH